MLSLMEHLQKLTRYINRYGDKDMQKQHISLLEKVAESSSRKQWLEHMLFLTIESKEYFSKTKDSRANTCKRIADLQACIENDIPENQKKHSMCSPDMEKSLAIATALLCICAKYYKIENGKDVRFLEVANKQALLLIEQKGV